jgi:hypothetical protein
MARTPRPVLGLRALVVGLVVALGLANLPRALAGDQALFVTFSRELHQGSVLYRDLWDAKQPGIFAFYWLSSRLFGADEVGVHLGELVVLIALTLVLQRTLPDLGLSRQAAALAPLAIVVPYQLFSTTWDLTQPEPLIGLPLYVAFWASMRAHAAPRSTEWRWRLLAGAATGVVTIFKLVYGPIGLVFLIGSLHRTGRVRAIAVFAAGGVAAWSPVLVWVVANRLVHEVAYTWLVFPRTSRHQGAPPVSALGSNLRSFGRSFAPVLAFALVGVWANRGRFNRWMSVALAWIIVASALALAQFWWRYLFWNLGVPIGLFAVVGAQHVVDRARRDRRVLVAAATALVVLIVVAGLPHRERYEQTVAIPFDDGARAALRAAEEETYAQLDATLGLLRAPDAQQGPIAVFGNPIVQFESGRRQAGSIPGYLVSTLGPRKWNELAAELRADPPAYVFIGFVHGRDQQLFLDTRGRMVQAIFDEDYCEAQVLPHGRWLVRCR